VKDSEEKNHYTPKNAHNKAGWL